MRRIALALAVCVSLSIIVDGQVFSRVIRHPMGNPLTTTTVPSNHPRIWLTSSMLSLIAAKQAAGDADWLEIKAAADVISTQTIPRLTVVSATNANPVVLTTSQLLPWTGTANVYLVGGTGGWAGINNAISTVGVTATSVTTHSFSIPVNSTSFGAFGAQALTFFMPGGENNPGYLSYGQTGSGWYDAFLRMGLVYQTIGGSAYSTKAKELLDWLNELGAAGMISPISQDAGRASFGASLGLAVGFDWFYSALTVPEKTGAAVTLNLWQTWTINNAFGLHDPTTNYWEGHVTASAAIGYGTYGDNLSAQTWIDWASNTWYDDFDPYFFESPVTTTHNDPKGTFYNGLTANGFTYGGSDIARHLKYMLLVRHGSSGAIDLFALNDYAQRWATTLIHELKPDRWKSVTWGRWPGSYYGAITLGEALLLSDGLNGHTEGAWAQWFYNHFNTVDAPPGIVSNFSYPEVQDRLMFYDASRTQTDYRLTQPTYRFADGPTAITFWRSNWNDTADFAWFNASTANQALQDLPRFGGHLDLSRGTDYLLVESQMWKGTGDGVNGVPELEVFNGGYANTLYYWDGGSGAGGNCFVPDGQYDGCQLGFGVYKAPTQKLSTDYFFAQNEWATAYAYFTVAPPARTLKYFFRAFEGLGDGTYLVWDRILSASAGNTKQIRWQLSSASTPTVASGVISSVVGSSKLFVNTLLPASASIALVRNQNDALVNANWRAQVTDAAPGTAYTGLTVLYTTAAAGTLPTTTILATIDSNFSGVQVADTVAKVFIVPHGVTVVGDGTYASTTYTSTSFTSTHSGTGKYLVSGLAAGTYTVSRNGLPLVSTSVDATGVLYFTASSGAFTIAVGAGCAGGSISLSSDIILDGANTLELIGTAGSHCTLTGNGHRIIVSNGLSGHITMDYVDATGLGDATHDAIGGDNVYDDPAPIISSGYVDIQHSTFHSGGGVTFATSGSANITFSNNVYAVDNLISVDYTAATSRPWFLENGSSATAKHFQGNISYRSYVSVGSPNWTVGGSSGCTSTCAAESNLILGYRAGIAVRGSGSYVAYNYTHGNLDVTPTVPFWSQVPNLIELRTGVIAEHNIVRSAHWVTQIIDGTLRYNVLLETHGHDFLRTGTGGVVDHNIMATAYPGIGAYGETSRPVNGESSIFLTNTADSLTIYNNTMDVRGTVSPSALWVSPGGATVPSYRNNFLYQIKLLAVGCPTGTSCTSAVGLSSTEGYVTPPPNRAGQLDYNGVQYDASTARQATYDIGVPGLSVCDSGWGSHDLGTCPNASVNPVFKGPLTIGSGKTGTGCNPCTPASTDSGFPFNDADIIAGTYTVPNLLAYFRWIYGPGVGSPLISAGSDGGNIGCCASGGSAPSIVTTNKKPMVYAGPSYTVTLAAGVFLSAWGADDGLPSDVLTFAWSKVSGPGTVSFVNSTNAMTAASFTQGGTYVLRLTASDGALTATSDVTITVLDPSTTYYVSQSGNDANSCATAQSTTQANQKRTIAAGLTCLNAGSVLRIHGGTYPERIFEVDFAHTGTGWGAGQFITVGGYAGETVTLTVGSGGAISRFQDGSVHHVLLDNMIFDGTNAGGGGGTGNVLYFGDTSHDLHFNNLEVKNGQGVGVLGSGDSHELRNLNVHGNGTSGILDGIYKHNNGAYLSILTNSSVIGGSYWDNECIGLRIGSSAVANASNNIIDGVRAYDNGAGYGLGGLSPCDSIGGGILLADVNNTAQNNLVYHNQEGIVLYPLSGKNATGLKVYNNTVYNNGTGIEVAFPSVIAGQLINNIIYSNSTNLTNNGAGTVTTTNLTANPLFTNAAANIFTLQPGSPAIDAGTTLPSVTTDFNGNPRVVPYDIGAYVYP